MSLDNLQKSIAESPFAIQAENHGTSFERCLHLIGRFCSRDKWKPFESEDLFYNKDAFNTLKEIVKEKTPPFQRNNDKWTKEMQTAFVFNLIRGYQSQQISLYSLEDNVLRNCFILDGLQRTTAIIEFYSGNMIFDYPEQNIYISSKEIIEEQKKLWKVFDHTPFYVRAYKFNTELEAVDFYIDFNRNITHSDDDIEKALKYRNQILLQKS